MPLVRLTTRLLVTGALLALTSCSSESDSDAVSRRDCERMRDHLVELRMQSVTADQDQHRIAIRSALDESFVSACVENTTESQLHCALTAKDTDALAACVEPTSP